MGKTLRHKIAKEGIELEEFDAIRISLLDFQIASNFDGLVFTSQNGVRSFLGNKLLDPKTKEIYQNKEVFCVGSKTAEFLKHEGFNMVINKENAEELSKLILAVTPKKSYALVVGNRSQGTIKKAIIENGIRFTEILGYQTDLNPKPFHDPFNALMFFSPSGVQSYKALNDFKDQWSVCIGKTTAQEAKKHSEKVIYSKVATVGAVVELTIKQLKQIA